MITKNNLKITPLEDRVVLNGEVTKEKTLDSGIVLPETAQRESQKGTVLAVGPGRYERGNLIPMQCKVGDTVIYSKYAGQAVNVDGEEVIVIKEADILCVLG